MKITQASPRPLSPSVFMGGGGTVTVALLTRWTVGSPLAVLHTLENFFPLPPTWLMSLLWLASFALAGGAAGYLLTCPGGGGSSETLFWRGSTFWVLGVVFSLVWYTLLVGKFFLLPSWFCLILSAAASLVCAVSWTQVKSAAAVAMFLYALWQIGLLLLQLAVLLTA